MTPNVIDYSEVRAYLQPGQRHNLLLGNGFSIGCDSRFSYTNLYEKAVNRGLSKRAQNVFEKLGTNNFEAVMRLLDNGHWLAKNYSLIEGDESDLKNDLDLIKETLVSSIANSHPTHTGMISTEKKQAAASFFDPYHSIFTTNYDLLPVWINMASKTPLYQDGFRSDSDDPTSISLVFSERLKDKKGMYFVHGALHLFMGGGGLRKHCWGRTQIPIIDLVKIGLSKNRYPLFVAEGTSDKKMEQIQSNGYLSYCFGKLGRIENRLVTLGFSFGESDDHISDQIAANDKINELYVGLFAVNGNYDQKIIDRVQRIVDDRKASQKKFKDKGKSKNLNVIFFRSDTARVWG